MFSPVAEAFLCRKKTGEKGKKARRARWEGDREEERWGSGLLSLPIHTCALTMLLGCPAGASAEERLALYWASVPARNQSSRCSLLRVLVVVGGGVLRSQMSLYLNWSLKNGVFSHDVTAGRSGVDHELCSYVQAFLAPINLRRCWPLECKRSTEIHVVVLKLKRRFRD